MPNARMSRLHASPRHGARVGSFLLLCSVAACDSGVVTIKPLTADDDTLDAGTTGSTAGGRAPAGGSGSEPNGPRGGAGGMQRPQQYPCDELGEDGQEAELLQALNDAISSGRYCPRLSQSRQRPLEVTRELEAQARSSICFMPQSHGWIRLFRSPVLSWIQFDVPNLEDAKKALLGGEHEIFCDEAEKGALSVGVGHFWDSWSILVAPVDQQDMQKP
jgi:hypothetical protein